MKAKIKIEMRRQPVAQPRGIGILNPCQCGCSQPLFRRTDCGGFTLCCPECGTRIDQCVKTLTTENANYLRECWNNSILDAPLTQRFIDELGAENGSLLIVRDEDAVIMSIHNNDIDEALVGVHDGVRPFVSQKVVDDCFREAWIHGAAIPMIELQDSLRHIVGGNGVTEVVRGADLLSSAPRQMYLQDLFGLPHPSYAHVSMLLAPDGRRLSKRDRDLDLGVLRQNMTAPQLIGKLAFAAGLTEKQEAVSAEELAREFSWEKVRKGDILLPE